MPEWLNPISRKKFLIRLGCFYVTAILDRYYKNLQKIGDRIGDLQKIGDTVSKKLEILSPIIFGDVQSISANILCAFLRVGFSLAIILQ